MPNPHNLCGFLDFAGSQYRREFLVRELGAIGIGKNFPSPIKEWFDYKPKMTAFCDNATPPNKKRKQTHSNTVVYDLPVLNQRILNFWNSVKTKKNKVIAFKGGVCEKNILKELKIPYFNLEDINCPRYNDMDTEEFEAFSCKYHKDHGLHCPAAEVACFKNWYLNNN